ncbi:MAG: hypothetical protein JWR09_830 [Mucilaginibacter sp.]|nr:hypothetical protein [Mucilaginibacter sp.]
MKKYLFLSIAITILICRANGAISKEHINHTINNVTCISVIKQDTIKYLQDKIIIHKEKFQHKELNILLKEMNLTVKSYIFIHGSKPGGPPKCITLFFDDPNNTSKKLRNRIDVPFLNIYFEDEISRDKLSELLSKSHGSWLEGENNFFGKMLVKDVTGLSTGKN